MGPGGHILTFPVDHGETLNLVAFKTTSEDWEDPSHLTKPARQEDLLRDFEGYAPYIQKLLKLTKPDLDIVRTPFDWTSSVSMIIKKTFTNIGLQWAIFDLGDHPVPTF